MMILKRLVPYLDRLHNLLLLSIPFVLLLMNGGFIKMNRLWDYPYLFLLYSLFVARFYVFIDRKVAQPVRLILTGLLTAAILGFIYTVYHSSGLI